MMSKRRVHYELPAGDWTTKHDGTTKRAISRTYATPADLVALDAAESKRITRHARNLRTLRVYA